MKIVDAQVHIWANSTPERPWPPRHPAHRAQDFSATELLAEMDAAGVDAAILVPPSWEGEYNDLVTQAVVAHPSRFAAMGHTPGVMNVPPATIHVAGSKEFPFTRDLRRG